MPKRMSKAQVRRRIAECMSKMQKVMFDGSDHITIQTYGKLNKMYAELNGIRARLRK